MGNFRWSKLLPRRSKIKEWVRKKEDVEEPLDSADDAIFHPIINNSLTDSTSPRKKRSHRPHSDIYASTPIDPILNAAVQRARRPKVPERSSSLGKTGIRTTKLSDQSDSSKATKSSRTSEGTTLVASSGSSPPIPKRMARPGTPINKDIDSSFASYEPHTLSPIPSSPPESKIVTKSQDQASNLHLSPPRFVKTRSPLKSSSPVSPRTIPPIKFRRNAMVDIRESLQTDQPLGCLFPKPDELSKDIQSSPADFRKLTEEVMTTLRQTSATMADIPDPLDWSEAGSVRSAIGPDVLDKFPLPPSGIAVDESPGLGLLEREPMWEQLQGDEVEGNDEHEINASTADANESMAARLSTTLSSPIPSRPLPEPPATAIHRTILTPSEDPLPQILNYPPGYTNLLAEVRQGRATDALMNDLTWATQLTNPAPDVLTIDVDAYDPEDPHHEIRNVVQHQDLAMLLNIIGVVSQRMSSFAAGMASCVEQAHAETFLLKRRMNELEGHNAVMKEAMKVRDEELEILKAQLDVMKEQLDMVQSEQSRATEMQDMMKEHMEMMLSERAHRASLRMAEHSINRISRALQPDATPKTPITAVRIRPRQPLVAIATPPRQPDLFRQRVAGPSGKGKARFKSALEQVLDENDVFVDSPNSFTTAPTGHTPYTSTSTLTSNSTAYNEETEAQLHFSEVARHCKTAKKALLNIVDGCGQRIVSNRVEDESSFEIFNENVAVVDGHGRAVLDPEMEALYDDDSELF